MGIVREAGDAFGRHELGVALAETHVSVVFFVGDRAYKLKKPVKMDFLDFSTRERRLAVCRREVELNRRMAPDVYLGVSDVLGVDGELCDHLVVMRRMPAERRLSTLVRAGSDVSDELRSVARVVASFHARAQRSVAIDAEASPAAITKLWESNLREMHAFEGDPLDARLLARCAELGTRYLDGRGELLARRVSAGHVRDCHGDLLAGDIFCLDDGPRVLDCIEFDDRLRYTDVVADVAFLAMDLERLGAMEQAVRFLAWYREFSGEWYPSSLADFYVAQRALVRSKVACLRYRQGVREAAPDATALLAIALRHLEAGRVRLVLVGGLPGTGKTTLALGIADATNWTVLRSDEVRKDLAGIAHDEPASRGYRGGIYTDDWTARTYAELLERAGLALASGETVILDASWSQSSWREAAVRVASTARAELLQLRCRAPGEVAASRIRSRRHDASDATPDVAAAMASTADAWPEALAVDTSRPADDVLAEALQAVR